jgi:hypothetical protein
MLSACLLCLGRVCVAFLCRDDARQGVRACQGLDVLAQLRCCIREGAHGAEGTS